MMHERLSKSTNLTQHFKYGELNKQMAKCADFVVLSLYQLALFLEVVRLNFGKPIIVTSGYRTPQHNAAVGGVKDSSHMLGKAVDFTCKNPFEVVDGKKYTSSDFKKLCFAVDRSKFPPGTYIKVYSDKGFIHIQFGEKDEVPLNLLPYFPFNHV